MHNSCGTKPECRGDKAWPEIALCANLFMDQSCRYMDLEAFVEEATVANAVVWLSLQGSGVTGPLQQWLEDYHVPFVGELR